jgi:hypothetical protein
MADELQTEAWTALETNLDMLGHLIALSDRELAALSETSKRREEFVTHIKEQFEGGHAPEPLLDALIKGTGRLESEFTSHMDRVGTATLWQVVMLVTCVEAYLKHVFEDAASLDPELMKASEQSAPYHEVLSATSIDELAKGMRQRWARRRVDDGGPTTWVSSFEKMGVRRYPPDLAARLERIWGARHLVVHSAGVVTREFLRRHPSAAKAVGESIKISAEDFAAFLTSVAEFLSPIEKYFLARYPELGRTPTATTHS